MSWPKAAQWPGHGSRAQHCHRSHAVTCRGNTQVKESCALWCSVGLPFPHAILTMASMWRSWGLCDVVGNRTSLCIRNQTNTCEVTFSLACVFAFPFLSQANSSMLKLLNHCNSEIHPASFNEVIRWSPDLRPEWLRGSRSHLQTSSRNPPIRAPHNPMAREKYLEGYVCTYILWGNSLFMLYISMYSYHYRIMYNVMRIHLISCMYHHTIFNIRLTRMVSIQFWYPPSSCVLWDLRFRHCRSPAAPCPACTRPEEPSVECWNRKFHHHPIWNPEWLFPRLPTVLSLMRAANSCPLSNELMFSSSTLSTGWWVLAQIRGGHWVLCWPKSLTERKKLQPISWYFPIFMSRSKHTTQVQYWWVSLFACTDLHFSLSTVHLWDVHSMASAFCPHFL